MFVVLIQKMSFPEEMRELAKSYFLQESQGEEEKIEHSGHETYFWVHEGKAGPRVLRGVATEQMKV